MASLLRTAWNEVGSTWRRSNGFALELADAIAHGRGSSEGWRVRKDGVRPWVIGETTPLFNQPSEPIDLVQVYGFVKQSRGHVK